MIKLKKQLDDTFPVFIDLFYGIVATWISYYKIFVVSVGMFYLLEIFPGNIKILGEIPQGFTRAEIQKGTFSIFVMITFVFIVIFRMMDNAKRAEIYAVCENLIGSFLVILDLCLDPIVTFDRILIFICCFVLIKLGLTVIIRVFKISTRHFGSIETEVICSRKQNKAKMEVNDDNDE
jgi:hypothetical protein